MLKQILDRLLVRATETVEPSFRTLAEDAGLDPGHDFIGASLRNLDFRDEDLRGFNFSNADLRGADFRRADVTGVAFDGAMLFGAIGLERPIGLWRPTILVVDDDPAIRDNLSVILSAGGYEVICFVDGAQLLPVARSITPACILLDVNIPGKSGLDILKELRGEDYPAPIFMISGQGDIAMAVSAIKNGALDFIEKPFRGGEILARLNEAIGAFARRQAENSATRIGSPHFPGREPLTRREREVLEQFASGASNKEAGRTLGISPRTIEDHRANIMKKLGARNAADLIRIVMQAQR